MHVDIAHQRHVDCRRVRVGARADRRDIRWGGDLGIGKVEGQDRVEGQCQLLLVQHRGDTDPVGHLEHETDEGGLHQRANPHRRLLLGGVGGTLHAQQALGGAGALGKLADHLLRQRRRRAGPAVGQEVDEDALAGGHGVDGDAARQRQTDRRAVGIAARGADIIGHRILQFLDGDIDRTFEADHDDRAGGRDLRFDILLQLQHQPGIAVRGRECRLTWHRVFGPRRSRIGKGCKRKGGGKQA
ncbi:hypothetical protein ACVIWU_002718 [Bradyrhizobium sp. USDA 4509]